METSPPDATTRRVFLFTGLVLLVVAATVLAGRFAGWLPPVTLVPDGPPMAFPSAVGFLLGGAGFVAIARGWRGGARAMGALVIAVGLGTLLLHAAADTMGWWRLFLDPDNPPLASGLGFDGRMAPNTAGSFAALGLAIVLVAGERWWPRLVTLCAAGVVAVAGMALVGYATGLRSASLWWRLTGMAAHAAALFFLAAGALMIAVARGAPERLRPALRTFQLFTLGSMVLVVLLVIVEVSNAERDAAERWLRHTHEVRGGIERFIGAMARADTAARTFVLTGDEYYAGRMATHRATVLAVLDEIAGLTADNAAQRDRVAALRRLATENFALKDAQAAERRARGLEAAAAAIRAEPPGLIRGLRAATDGMLAEENRLLPLREEATRRNVTRLRWALGVGEAAVLGLMGAAFALVMRARDRLREANDALALRAAALAAAQAGLAASNRLQRAVLDGNIYSIIATRPDGTIEIFSRGAEQLLGYAAAEVVGRATPALIHDPAEVAARATELTAQLGREIAPGFEAFVARARLGEVDEREWTYVRKDGARVPVLLSVTALRDEAGAITGFLGIAHDLTQRQAAERALRESEERFRQAFDYAGAGMAIVGLDGRWLRVNTSLCDILGYTEPALTKRTFQDITHPEDLEADLAHVRELLAGERRVYRMDKRYFHREGHVVWIRLTASLVRDAHGAPLHFVSQIEDVTEQRRLEKNLAVARDAALAASRMKSEFLANMSHEIRTPMNAVVSMGLLLADTPLAPAQQEMVRAIQGGAEGLLTIMDDMLDFAKIEAGKLRLAPAEFDLQQVIEETAALLAPRAHARGVEVTCEFELIPPPRLHGDAGRVRQVFTNLLGNAIKFTERGAIRVTVRTVAAAAQRATVRVEVRDTGVGIAPEARTRLFQPFMQEDASITRRFGGTGLGLAISRQLVELMGGEIGCESEPGRGSVFWFEVGFAQGDGSPAPAVPLPPGRRVLVVDGDAGNRRIALGQLARLGVNAEAVADASAALASLADPTAGPWHAVLIDRDSPGMGGLALATAIRARPAPPPLLLLSLTGPAGDFAAAGAAGIAVFLTKPVGDAALRRGLARALGAALESVAPPVPSGRSLRLLLVEDNPSNQRVAALLLAKLGHEADLATDGQQALERLAGRAYDAVLMDCQMPGLDGYQAARRIRSGSVPGVNPRVPIIALTAYALAGDRARCLAAGMDEHLTKPLRPADLAAALARCGLGAAGPFASAPAPTADGPPVIDAEVVASVRALPGRGGGTLLADLVRIHLEEEPAHLARIRRLLATREAEELADAAHALGGTATVLGGLRVRGAALALEEEARAGDWPGAAARAEALFAACAELRAGLSSLDLAAR